MQNQFFKKRFLSFLLAIIMIVGFLPFKHISNADVKVNEIYLDSAKGDDNSDGTKEKPVKTFAKAIEKAKDGDTLNVISLTETNITVNKKITLKFISDATMQGSGTAITLKDGAHLCVAEGKTLNINGYNKGILVEKGAEINDGNYVFKFPDNGFAFETSGNIVGTSKDKLKMDITNGYFMFHSKDNELRNATINQRYEGDKWQLYEWNGFKAFNSEINLYRLPVYFKGPLYLDNTKFVIDGTGVNYQTGAYFENSWEVGVFHFTNNSIFEVKNFNTNWRSKGITFGYGNRVLVDNKAKIVVKNNGNGGFNANEGIATFNGGYLEGDGHSGSLFGAQDKANTKIVFGADSVVNTPMKADSDNGLGQSGTNYIVIGGSHKVKYSPNYQGGLAIPVNGEENGNEKLTWFQLKDKNLDKLAPINKNGKTYDYSVKNPSDDGNKYVWTPAAKVTFKLNNADASFADKTNEDKEFKTIRGYKLDDVVGNVNPGEATDKNGVKFLGWYYKTDKGEEKAFDWNGKLTADTEVYAKWERKTAIYHNGAGKDYISSVSKDAKNIEVLSFEDILKEKDDFKVEGKKFVGWTTASDGSGKVYNAKEKINFTEGQTQIDLYAKYTDDEYKVSFSANGGTFSDNSIFKTKKDVFTIEKDKNGGDVAVLKKTAKYNDKLFDLLNALNFDHNSLKPDKDATKTGFVIGNKDNWSTTAEPGGTGIRFDDYTFFGFAFNGKNPQITSDTTYYLTWKDDPNIPNENKISSQETIDSDIWSDSKQTSKDIKIISENKEFSLTGEVNVSSIKDKMKAIEGMFNKEEKDFDKISLTGAKSTFTATLTLPKEVEAPKNLQVEAKGLGDCFEVSETKVNGQKITVTFKLKDGMTDYKKLKEAVLSTGDKDNTLSVTVNGLKLKDFDKIKDGQKFTIKGEVKGDFSAVAKDGDTIKKFDFKWTGNQSKEGKDVESKDDSAIQYTIMVSKPVQLTLGGDLLVKKGEEAYNTEHDMVYPVDKEDFLTFDGKLDVSSIKNQIQSLKDDFDKNNNNTSDEITTKDVKSEFIAELTVPEGLEIPQNPTATLTNNNLFEIKNGDAKIDGNKITVKMTLKKDYTKFIDLYTDVTSVNDKLDLEIPNVKVKDTAQGNLTVKGEVSGTFIGVATKKDLNTKVFNYKWTGKQTPDGKDFTQSKDDNDSINLTVKLPQELTLAGDILIGDDTEHNALHEVKRGDVLEYTGRLDVSSIKNQIKLLKDNYAGNSDTITTENIKSEFVAELTIPDGLEIPANLKATLTENKLFEIKNGDVKRDGNKIIVKMTLKNANYTKFSDLYNDVTSVSDILDLKVSNIKVKGTVKSNDKLTVIGKVIGKFTGVATNESSKKEVYNYKWTAEQTEDGKDFLIKDQKDNKTIQYTVIVKEETSPGENPGKNPDENPGKNPDEKPGENPGENPDKNPDKNPDEKPGEKPDKKPDENPKDKPSVNKKQKLVKTNISQSSILLVLASGVLVSFVKKKKK